MGSKVGLVGYSANCGLGEFNRQFAIRMGVDYWLVVPHRSLGINPVPEEVGSWTVGNPNRPRSSEQFLRSVDVVVFFETPYISGLARRAKELGKRVVCIPMLEWTPEYGKEFTKDVDLWICPTKICYETLSKEGFPAVYYNWPVDVDRYKFRLRSKCERFLFVNGSGGWRGRKGADVIKSMLEVNPGIPLVVRSQSKISLPGNDIEYLPPVKDNLELYNVGDVLLAPHHLDGYGLEMIEAQASGMPVIVSEGNPWNEFHALSRIPYLSTKIQRVKRPMTWYHPDAEYLAELCDDILGEDIEGESYQALNLSKLNSWNVDKEQELENLVLSGSPSGVPSSPTPPIEEPEEDDWTIQTK